MPYDGSNGIFTTLYNFVTDASNGIKILASRVQGQCNDIATGLTTALTKDGQTTPTANLPMGGFIHTNVGNASARNNYAVTSQVQDGSYVWTGTLSGTDTYTGTLSPAIVTYTTGAKYRSYVTNANTGAATVNLNSLGAKSFKKNGSAALTAGDIPAASIIEYAYDGTNFQLLNVANLASLAGGTFTGPITLPNTGLKILDTNASHTLGIVPGSDLTANRTLTVTTGDSSRAVTLSGDFTVTAAASVSGNNFGAIYSSISGFLPLSSSAITGNSTTAAVTIPAGQATDSTLALTMIGAGFSWLVSNGNAANGYSGGTTLPNSSTIHFFVIATPTDTTWTASFASTSLTPTLPGAYVGGRYRRVFSLNTTGAGALIPGSSVEVFGGAQAFYLTTEVLDVNVSNLGTSRTLYPLTVPSGIKVEPFFRIAGTTNPSAILLTSPEQSDVAPGTASTVPLQDAWNDTGQLFGRARNGFIVTDTSGRIGARSSTASTVFYLVTFGWCDFRR